MLTRDELRLRGRHARRPVSRLQCATPTHSIMCNDIPGSRHLNMCHATEEDCRMTRDELRQHDRHAKRAVPFGAAARAATLACARRLPATVGPCAR